MDEVKGKALLRTVFDAIPMPVFVVDDDMHILDLNEAGIQLCGRDKELWFRRRGGEVLHCLHSTDVPEGCGRGPSCKKCVMRNSVNKSFDGRTVARQRMKMEIVNGNEHKVFDWVITASPVPDRGENLALLMIEDVTELSTLRNLIPICMKCKKVRQDEQYWTNVENYFHEQVGVDFSHGICPSCVEDFYPEFRKKQD